MAEIIVGYDGSDSSRAALDQAVDLAKSLGDGVVLVFGYAPHGYGGGEVKAQRDAVKELGERVTAEGLERAKSAGVEAEVELEPTHPVHALNEAVRKRNGRMIVVGNYGEAPLKGAILGSTTSKLLHEAEAPVLVVPKPG